MYYELLASLKSHNYEFQIFLVRFAHSLTTLSLYMRCFYKTLFDCFDDEAVEGNWFEIFCNIFICFYFYFYLFVFSKLHINVSQKCFYDICLFLCIVQGRELKLSSFEELSRMLYGSCARDSLEFFASFELL